jgi:hypothetical protein
MLDRLQCDNVLGHLVLTRIAADLLDMTRLHQVSNHLMREGEQIDSSLDKVVEAAVAIRGRIKAMYNLLILLVARLRWPLNVDSTSTP